MRVQWMGYLASENRKWRRKRRKSAVRQWRYTGERWRFHTPANARRDRGRDHTPGNIDPTGDPGIPVTEKEKIISFFLSSIDL